MIILEFGTLLVYDIVNVSIFSRFIDLVKISSIPV